MNWNHELETLDARRVRQAVQAAVQERGLLAVSGPRGTGKTWAVWRALEPLERAGGVRVAEPIRLDRERLTIADVLTALVRDLSDEAPRHSGEGRAGQVRRLLRAASGGVALLIDDAHGLHHQTLRALKRLRELGARGRRQGSLAVILVGQHDAAQRVPEVGLRAAHLALAGLARREIEAAARAACGGAVDDAALRLLADAPGASNWLDLQALLRACQAAAAARGESRITADAAAQALAPARAAPEPGAPAADRREAMAEALRRRRARPDAAGREAAA